MAGRKRDGDPELITATAGRRKYAPEMEGYVSDLSNQLLADFRNRDQLLRDTEALIFRRHALEVPGPTRTHHRREGAHRLDMVN